MKDKKTDKTKSSIFRRGILLPVGAVGAGLFTGSLAGGALGRAITTSPRFLEAMKNASPAKRQKLLNYVRYGTTAVGTAAGGAMSALAAQALQDELDKRDKEREKTAMFHFCFEALAEDL